MYWIKEENPLWDENKVKIIGSNIGCFVLDGIKESGKLVGEWFYLRDECGQIIGYGWIEIKEREAEISLAVDKKYKGNGYGTQIINNLYNEVKNLGIEEIIAVVRVENSNAEDVIRLAYKNGYIAEWPGLGNISLERAGALVKKSNITLRKRIF